MKLHRINALLLKYYYITRNRVDRIFDLFYWPIIDVIIWGFAIRYIKSISNYDLLSMIMGGIVLWVITWRSTQDIAVYILEDFWSKNLYHLFSSPVRISEHMVSIILWGLIRGAITFIFLTIITYLMYSFNIFLLNPLFLAVSITLLVMFGWAMGLMISSIILRYGQRIQVLAWSVVWIIQPFSCVFYPLSSLPQWAKNIAILLPTTHVFENLRLIISTNTVNYASLAYAFSANLILILFMSYMVKVSFEHARKTGLLAKGD